MVESGDRAEVKKKRRPDGTEEESRRHTAPFLIFHTLSEIHYSPHDLRLRA